MGFKLAQCKLVQTNQGAKTNKVHVGYLALANEANFDWNSLVNFNYTIKVKNTEIIRNAQLKKVSQYIIDECKINCSIYLFSKLSASVPKRTQVLPSLSQAGYRRDNSSPT